MVPDVVKLPVTRLTSEWPQPAIYAHEYERRMLDEEENEKRRNCFYRSINGQPSFWTQHSVA
jgi:hypothetical protein